MAQEAFEDVGHIRHSIGGGRSRYVARPGKGRVPQAVLISPIPPTFMNPDKNPDGVPKEVVDQIRNGILQRMLFYKKTRDYPH
jgi:non-heme chloroperoxidase